MESEKNNQSTISINTPQKRVIYFDILNIIACVAVLFLHCNGGAHNFSNTRLWKESLVVEVLFYYAVPMFIMLSGATLLKYKERYSTKQFFLKRFQKVVIPWIIWSLITYILKNKNLNMLQFFNDFIYQKIESVYWFFPLIIYLYCLIPVLSVLTEKKEYKKIIIGIITFIFIFQVMLQPICLMLHITFPNILNYMTSQNSFIIYLLLGYLLSNNELSNKKKYIIYICAIISLMVRYLYTMYASIYTGTLNCDSWGYTSYAGFFPTLALFLLAKDIKWENIFTKLHINATLISKISGCSFGVYLIHRLTKGIITHLLSLNINSIFYRLLFPLILYVICILIILILKKIPLLKKIVP